MTATPNTAALQADLAKLAKIPDDVIRAELRRAFVADTARLFQVPAAMAERRLAGIGPYLPAAPVTPANEGGV